MRLTFLGTGTSNGVPVIGYGCVRSPAAAKTRGTSVCAPPHS